MLHCLLNIFTKISTLPTFYLPQPPFFPSCLFLFFLYILQIYNYFFFFNLQHFGLQEIGLLNLSLRKRSMKRYRCLITQEKMNKWVQQGKKLWKVGRPNALFHLVPFLAWSQCLHAFWPCAFHFSTLHMVQYVCPWQSTYFYSFTGWINFLDSQIHWIPCDLSSLSI